jgi:predicted metal-dependent HD superfamily phosphohydrolase
VRGDVLATASHAAPAAGPGAVERAVFLDADMSVLAWPAAAYARYAAAIRAEFAHVPPEVFPGRRAEVLAGFLAQGNVFHSPMFAALEPRARANLEAEIERLRQTTE